MKLSAPLTFFNVPVVLHVELQEMRKCETLMFLNVPIALHVVLKEMRQCETLSTSHVFQCPCSTPRSTTGDEKV